MKLVLDASVAVKFYLPEIFEAEAGEILAARHQCHVPELIYSEFSSIVWKKVRNSELDFEEGSEVIDAFLGLDLINHSDRDLAMSAFTGADETGQTVCDWTYLALAISESCRLVTADRRFFEAIESTVFRENILWIGDSV